MNISLDSTTGESSLSPCWFCFGTVAVEAIVVSCRGYVFGRQAPPLTVVHGAEATRMEAISIAQATQRFKLIT